MELRSGLSRQLVAIAHWSKTATSPLAQELRGLRPGLSRTEINQTLENVGWQLPQEVYDFYQWKNGGSLRLSYLERIYSLEDAIALHQKACQRYETYDPELLPIFQLVNPDVIVGVRVGPRAMSTSPIYEWMPGRKELCIWHHCLADLVQAIAAVLV